MRHDFRDAHHIIHHRADWELRPAGKFIRRIPALVPVIDRSAHEYLHRNSPHVPLLGYNALQLVARDMRSYSNNPDTFAVVDALRFAIDDAGRHPRAHDVERQLAVLANEAIEVQLPFLKEALA